MERRRLGASGLVVSEICMGTMTFGLQADEATGFRLMDRCFDAGIDFDDAAEVHPVPPSAELAGDTEEIVGRWLKTKPREGVIIASKIAGAAHGWFNPPVRHGKAAQRTDLEIEATRNRCRRGDTAERSSIETAGHPSP